MASNIKTLITFVACFLILSCDSDPEAEALAERWTKHDWSQNQPELYVDINNDGQKERALVGFGKRTLFIAVYLQDDVTKMDFVEIFINKASQQNAICGSKASLQLERQNYALVDQLDPSPEGFKSCANCEGLLLQGDRGCDPFHIYWDHKNQMLSWWRN